MWKFVSAGNSGNHPKLFSLNGFKGRQTWEFDPSAGTPEQRAEAERLREAYAANKDTQHHSADELLRLQCADRIRAKKHAPPAGPVPEQLSPERVESHLKGAISFYECLQQDDGHWPGDYGGPMFLLPGLVIVLYTTGALDQIHSRGGATAISSWGKFWLAVLGVYSWDGMNPLTPEMWLLPHSGWTGIGWLHPGRFWCHCRMVYLPMSYVYGKRGTCKETPLTAAIRAELYPMPYGKIDWNAARNQCAKEDLYYPHPMVQAENVLMGSPLRRWALAECMKHIHYEDENTRYVDIGPVNKVINMLACWLEDPNGEPYKKWVPRLVETPG
ncbi:hypothetical protein GPECTOR_110g224 [Gonium pectorale]|uniref:Squalene cyclase N-terminal domain-containing protein n=1 Tax=Gonium pectorale TaxID=33097 RepID=A0A150FZA9_GONPE|nr:hypothetical protein GPECTOR_110g224 [Gonium pectorale]|eukprot:KXZ42932.1 hypothetical protein GPECTOR_110g224 [Gonium pectorale]